MPRVPRVTGPSVKSAKFPQQLSTADVGAVGRAGAALGRAVTQSGQMLRAYGEQMKEDAREREFTAKRLEAQQATVSLEHGDNIENNPAWESDNEKVPGFRDLQGSEARGAVDNDVLPNYDKAMDKIIESIADNQTRERLIQWAAENRLHLEVRARQWESGEGQREMRQLVTAGSESFQRDAIMPGKLDGDFGNQQVEVNAYKRDQRALMERAGFEDEAIDNALTQDVEQVRASSMLEILAQKRADAARRYFTDYKHEMNPRDRSQLRGKLEIAETEAKRTKRSAEIIDMLQLAGQRDSEYNDKVKASQTDRMIDEQWTGADIRAVIELVEFRESLSDAQAQKRDKETLYRVTKDLFETKSLSESADFLSLPPEMRTSLLRAERQVQAAAAGEEISHADSIRSLQQAMADPRWRGGNGAPADPLSVALEHAGTMNEKLFSILLTEARSQMDGKAPSMFKSNSDYGLNYMRHLYNEDGKSDAKFEEDNREDLMRLNDWLQREGVGPAEQHRIKEFIDSQAKASFDDSWWPGNAKGVTIGEMTDAQFDAIAKGADFKIESGQLKRIFIGWTPQSAVGGKTVTLTEDQAVRKTAREYIWGRNKLKSDGIDPPTDDEIDAAIAKALRGDDVELWDEITFRQQDNSVPQDGAYTDNEAFFKQRDRLKGEALVPAEIAAQRQVMSTALASVAASPLLVPFDEAGLARTKAKAESLGYNWDDPSIKLAMLVITRAGEKHNAGMSQRDAYIAVGLSPELADKWAQMGPKVFDIIPELQNMEAIYDAQRRQREAQQSDRARRDREAFEGSY